MTFFVKWGENLIFMLKKKINFADIALAGFTMLFSLVACSGGESENMVAPITYSR